MKLFKLTDQKFRTRPGYRNACLWGPGVMHKGDPEWLCLCSPGFIHAYTHPLLAVILNPIHGAYDDPVLWECEGAVAVNDHGLKVGCRELTTVRIIDLPVVSDYQRVRFAILCAMKQTKDAFWVRWATDWLSGLDRLRSTARQLGFTTLNHACSLASEAASLLGNPHLDPRDAFRILDRVGSSVVWAAETADLNLPEIAESVMREG